MDKPMQQESVMPPPEVNGWKAAPGDHLYQGRQLFDYIDGGGELYISYGFRSLVSRKYARSGRPDITLDLFDMGSSRNAFGVFSHTREKIEKDAGQGSEYSDGLMIFWKDRYYVSIMSQKETPEVKKSIFELAGKIARSIPNEGPLPPILDLLPRKGLVPESIRYFRHHVWLNSHYYIADRNILHIDDTTEAVLAKYGAGPKRTVLLLVEYPDEKAARLAHDDFTKTYLPELAGVGAVRIEDGTFTACRRRGRLVSAVFNAPSDASALQLIDEAEKAAEKLLGGNKSNER